MKVVLYILGISFILCIALSIMVVRTTGLSSGGEAFLSLLARGKTNEAYAFFTKDYKSKHSLGDFNALVIESGLSNYQSVKWVKDQTQEKEGKAYLAGWVTLKSNTPIYVEIDFTVEGDSPLTSTWKVNDFRIKRVINEQSTQQQPSS